MDIESSSLSLTTAGSSINAALGSVSAGRIGTPEADVTHNDGGPWAFVAIQSGGNPGGVTLSKCSLNSTGCEQGKGVHEGFGGGVGTATEVSTPAPTNNIVRRAGRAALLVSEKESCLIQDCPTASNVVTQLWAPAPQQRHCTSDVRRRHGRAAKDLIITIRSIVA